MSNPGPNVVSSTHNLGGGSPEQVGGASPSLVGFYGTTPVAQHTAATNVHTVAAGSTTTAYVNTTFDGSIGSTAYTIGDLVAALKTLGLIAS